MNRLEFLRELKQQTDYNIMCYSTDNLMTKSKTEYEREWGTEQEKLEIIEELIEEETENNFHLYTSIYNLKNDKEERHNIDLAYIENREKGISCYLSIDDFNENGKPEYMLVFCIHDKNDFDDEYEQIYTREIHKDYFESRKILRNEMQNELDIFEKFIECDKKSNKFFKKYYDATEINETEELE